MWIMIRKGIIGKKLGMTQVFAEDGAVVPVTVIEVTPSVVVQKKTRHIDGYEAIQLGYGRIKPKNTTKPLQGHFKAAGKGFFRVLREIRTETSGFEVGQEVKVDIFSPGEYVDIVGTSKGKGFAGSVKRHGFRGGRATHGSMFHRAPGSIGASAEPSRVFKGKKLPGHMGDVRTTVQNLLIFGIRLERNIMLVKGAVAGSRNSYVVIRQSIKRSS